MFRFMKLNVSQIYHIYEVIAPQPRETQADKLPLDIKSYNTYRFRITVESINKTSGHTQCLDTGAHKVAE